MVSRRSFSTRKRRSVYIALTIDVSPLSHKRSCTMIYKWNYHPPSLEEANEAARLAAQVGVHPVFGQMLRERGIYSPFEARRFFRPQLTDLHDPFLMNDMQVAVDRLNAAIARKERIMVYGDYDVDGVTSVALVYKFIHHHYPHIDYYIPDRYDEGYGVSR